MKRPDAYESLVDWARAFVAEERERDNHGPRVSTEMQLARAALKFAAAYLRHFGAIAPAMLDLPAHDLAAFMTGEVRS